MSSRTVAPAIALLVLLAYLPLFGNEFVDFDDDLYITDRPEIASGLGIDGLAWAFTTSQGANWFPLTRLSWMLDAELFGLSPRAFHATNLVLHLGASLLLLAALRRSTGATGPSAFVAGVFAVHPLHVESVAWAAARKDVLSGFFFAACLYAHVRGARSDRPRGWSLALGLSAALGLMSKPTLVTLPCVLLLLDYWPLGRLRISGHGDRSGLRTALVEKIPLFGLAALTAAATLWAQRAGGAVQSLADYPFPLRVANFLDSIFAYLRDAFWPTGLAVFYPYPIAGPPPWRIAAGLVVSVAISAAAWRWRERRPHLLVGWCWFLGMLLPVSGLIQVGQAARADRYTYLPLIGLALALAWAVRDAVAVRPHLRRALPALAGAALVLLAGLGQRQAARWRDSETLFTHALRVTRGNDVAHINLGYALAKRGEYGRAERELTRAIELQPASARAYGIRGEVRIASGQLEAARLDLARARELEPQETRWQVAAGRTALEAGDPARALADFDAALQRAPEAHDARAWRAFALLRLERREEAAGEFERVLRQPSALERRLGRAGVARVHAEYAGLLGRRGDFASALRHFDAALALEPGLGAVHAGRALALEGAGRAPEAVEAYRAALEHGERSALVLNNLAWRLLEQAAEQPESLREARVLAEEAARVSDRRDPAVLDTLASIEAASGDAQRSRATSEEALRLAESRGQEDLARSLRERLASSGAR